MYSILGNITKTFGYVNLKTTTPKLNKCKLSFLSKVPPDLMLTFDLVDFFVTLFNFSMSKHVKICWKTLKFVEKSRKMLINVKKCQQQGFFFVWGGALVEDLLPFQDNEANIKFYLL